MNQIEKLAQARCLAAQARHADDRATSVTDEYQGPAPDGSTAEEVDGFLSYLADMDYINRSPDVDAALKTPQDPRLPFKIFTRTREPGRWLIVRDSDASSDAFVQICAAAPGADAVVQGFLWGREARRAEWRHVHRGQVLFFVPGEGLRP